MQVLLRTVDLRGIPWAQFLGLRPPQSCLIMQAFAIPEASTGPLCLRFGSSESKACDQDLITCNLFGRWPQVEEKRECVEHDKKNWCITDVTAVGRMGSISPEPLRSKENTSKKYLYEKWESEYLPTAAIPIDWDTPCKVFSAFLGCPWSLWNGLFSVHYFDWYILSSLILSPKEVHTTDQCQKLWDQLLVFTFTLFCFYFSGSFRWIEEREILDILSLCILTGLFLPRQQKPANSTSHMSTLLPPYYSSDSTTVQPHAPSSTVIRVLVSEMLQPTPTYHH